MTTTIQISDGLWKELNDMKQRGETFEEVIKKALDKCKEDVHESNN